MAAADASSCQQRFITQAHCPEFSAHHPMIPTLYVMPWKQDMQHRRQVVKNARMAGISLANHEEALFVLGRERLCHGEERSQLTHPSFPSTHAQTGEPAQLPSHLSRYNSSLVTTRRLYFT